VGHSWSAMGATTRDASWQSAHQASGIAPSDVLGYGDTSADDGGVGDAGGYGEVYCFTQTP